MTNAKPVVILGRTDITKDEDDALREIGQALRVLGRDLHTSRAQGTAAAVAAGYAFAGGKPTYGVGPPSDAFDYIVFGDRDYIDRLREKIPDLDDRDWFILSGDQLFEAHHLFLTILSEKGLTLPQYRVRI